MADALPVWLPTIAGALHFAQMPFMAMAQRALDWRRELDLLTPFTRRLVCLMSGGLMSAILGLGVVVLVCHGRLVQCATGNALCVFLAVFWFIRGIVQVAFLARTWPTHFRWMHRLLLVLYPTLGGLYGAAALAESVFGVQTP